MKCLKIRKSNMHINKINKEYRKLIPFTSNLDNHLEKFEYGIIYTLYSDKFNSIEIGFAENHSVLECILSRKELILLDKKKGKKKRLTLIINTLDELGIKYTDKLNFKYSDILMRHLSTLGWPIGHSLFKHRKIKKHLSYT